MLAAGDADLTEKMVRFQADLADAARAKGERIRKPAGGTGFR